MYKWKFETIKFWINQSLYNLRFNFINIIQTSTSKNSNATISRDADLSNSNLRKSYINKHDVHHVWTLWIQFKAAQWSSTTFEALSSKTRTDASQNFKINSRIRAWFRRWSIGRQRCCDLDAFLQWHQVEQFWCKRKYSSRCRVKQAIHWRL